jgi:hypothetical protein
MATIQVVLDGLLLEATDRAVRRLKLNRSALIRDALREHLRRLGARDKERRDREGYRRRPVARDEFGAWERAAAWPDDSSGGRFDSTASPRPTRRARSSC